MILPSDHRLAEHEAIDLHDLVGEKFIGISNMPRVLRGVVDEIRPATAVHSRAPLSPLRPDRHSHTGHSNFGQTAYHQYIRV